MKFKRTALLVLYIITLVGILGLTRLQGASIQELRDMSSQQKFIMIKVFREAKKIDLQWTLTAIAWQESSFGKHRIGRFSKDYGIFQINLYSFKRRFKEEIDSTGITTDSIKRLLIEDFNVGFTAAVEELRFWQGLYGNNWRKVWASYNDGTHISNKGESYSRKIYEKIKILKQYMKEIS